MYIGAPFPQHPIEKLEENRKQAEEKLRAGAGKKLYQCRECGFKYAGKEWAEKCEAWCKEHKSCNLEIIKHAIREQETSNQ